VSILSNHFPEILDELNGGPPEPHDPGPGCCDPATTGHLCPACRREFEHWLDQVNERLPRPGEEFEPCGRQFTDGPLPADMPF